MQIVFVLMLFMPTTVTHAGTGTVHYYESKEECEAHAKELYKLVSFRFHATRIRAAYYGCVPKIKY